MKNVVCVVVLGVVADAGASEVSRERIQLAEAEALSLLSNAPPTLMANSCGSAPLPLAPIGPTVSGTWYTGSQNANSLSVIAWRLPCSATDSMVVITLTPTNGAPFVCTSRFSLLQTGGLIASSTNFWLNPDPGTINSYCGDLLAPITLAFDPRSSMPANFDMDQGMTIVFDGGIGSVGNQQLGMFAYDPSAYSLTPPPGPNSVEVHVRGSGAHYRNCTVSQGSQGGGIQYTASCDNESPLTARKFERLDY